MSRSRLHAVVDAVAAMMRDAVDMANGAGENPRPVLECAHAPDW